MGFSSHEPSIRLAIEHPGSPFQHFEVCCHECGDDEGVYSEQSPEIQQLRGPFATRDCAREIVALHRAMTERDW